MTDPYKVLGVSRDASDEEVKKHILLWRENIIPINIPTPIFPTLRLKR